MDLATLLKTKFPQGSQGGECIGWLHNVFNFLPVGVDPKGNDVNLKFAYVQRNGIIAGNIAEIGKGFRIGDCVFTTEGASKNWLGQWTGKGHMFCITGFDKDSLICAESNFSLDGKVNYGRRLLMTSPKIIGIIRAPFKIDLGLTLEINYDVFINNQPKWNLQILDDTAKLISQYTKGKLKVNFFPLGTKFKDWWYEDFPFNGVVYTVIAKSYMEQNVLPLSFTSHNTPADICALIVSPIEWQGSVSNGAHEIAWSTLGKPRLVQGECGPDNVSPWYPMPLIQHILIHELAHHLAYINGENDLTDVIDNVNRNLPGVFNNLDWNRIALNL